VANAQASGGSFREVFASVYLPTTVYETGIGAVTPVIPLLAIELGGSPALAAGVMALLGIGQVIGDIPAGHLAARLGDRKAMLYGTLVTLGVLIACALAPHWTVLAAGVFLLGMVNALFVLARQAYLTEVTPPLRRSRALSTMGGMQRMGALVGPFLGGAVMSLLATSGHDNLRAAFWLAVALALVTGLVVYLVPEIDAPGRVAASHTKTSHLLRDNWRMFATLGVAFILVGAVRQTRSIVLPLWSDDSGLSASVTSYIFGLSGLLDVALFYPGGRLMDKRGRLWVGIPSMMILGGSLLALPFMHAAGTIAVVAILMGLGNGIGAGILMTIGADLAPTATRAQFLSLTRMFADSGGGVGPLVVAGGAALGALGGGIALMGVAGFAAAAIFAVYLPRYSVHANRHTRIAAGLTPQGAEIHQIE
jgi:MFS family permease